MPFCPNCKKLVYPVGGKMQCKNAACGWTSEGPVTSNPVAMGVAEGRKRVVLEEKQEARPLQNVQCPKCGHGRAYFYLMQTRRSDEPPTQINECEKCKHSWRDYQ